MSAQVGVRTRARAALAMEPDNSAKPSLKRKKMSSSNSNQEQKLSKAPRKETNQQCVTTHLHQDRIKLLDLELESPLVEIEMSTTLNSGKQIHRNEMNRSSKLHENSQEPEPIEINSHRATSKERTMPTELELEEFFAAAEKDIQKRFQDKYNYDIVKDVPLEGLYEWVPLKP